MINDIKATLVDGIDIFFSESCKSSDTYAFRIFFFFDELFESFILDESTKEGKIRTKKTLP